MTTSLGHEPGNGVGLVAVGHYESSVDVGHRPVDYQAGVFHLGLVERLGENVACLVRLKHSVSAVFAAAADKVSDHGLVIFSHSYENASAGIRIVPYIFSYGFHIHTSYV